MLKEILFCAVRLRPNTLKFATAVILYALAPGSSLKTTEVKLLAGTKEVDLLSFISGQSAWPLPVTRISVTV